MFSKDFDHKDTDHKKFNHNIHIVSPSYYWGVLNLLPNFQIGGLDRISIFKRVARKRGDNFFQGGCSFYIKNKIKSATFNYKKTFITKNHFLCHR